MKVLVTGSGCPGWYTVASSLREAYPDIEIIGCDASSISAGNVLTRKNLTVPSGNHSDYTDKISSIIKFYEIDAVIPLTDPELHPLSFLKETKVLCSSHLELVTSLSKDMLYKALPDISPYWTEQTSLTEVEEFIDKYSDGESCYIKLHSGYGSRGTKKIVSDKTWLSGFADQKPEAFGSSFPLSSIQNLDPDIDFMLLETLPGAEYSIDCVFNKESSLVFYGVREREFTRNGICHTAKFVVDQDNEFLEFINRVREEYSFRYNINIQARRDKKGRLKLLEINPRISGSIGSFVSAGYNLPALGLSLLLDDSFRLDCLTPSSYKNSRSYRVSHFVF